MDRVLEFAAYALIALGALVLLAMLLGRWIRKIGPSTEEREALGSDICKDGVHPDECPSCRPLPPCPAVVAGDDLDPLEALYRAPTFNGERAFRVPGEGR